MKKIVYLDLIGGASGDMLLAALIDAGADEAAVRAAVKSVVGGINIEGMVVNPAGLRARKVTVNLPHAGHTHRPYRVIRDLIERSGLEPRVKKLAADAFFRLAEAEGHVHGVPPLDVEFHEVGSDDAIADIVGVSAALCTLAPDEVICSPVPLGRGVGHSAHGPIPLPGPATLELLKGVPIEGVDLAGETVTPTGAALLRAIVTRFGRAPRMIVSATGVGAGTRTWPDRPNILRAWVAEVVDGEGAAVEEDCVVEANLDDMSPEHAAALNAQLFKSGAADVWSAPIAMKKGRTGLLVSALARRNLEQAIATTFFRHSTTLGVRVHPVSRIRGERHMEEVDTRYGRVRVKIAERPGEPALVAPEYDDCEALAQRAGVSVRAVHEAALYAAWQKKGHGG